MASHPMRFMDVDIISTLEAEMKRNTKSYQSDFELDKKLILQAAQSRRPEDKTLLWMSRPSGTHCVKEYEAFIRDTAAYSTWCFYNGHKDTSIVAFTAEICGTKDGVIRGNLYKLNYPEHAAEVASKAVPLLQFQKTFEDGFEDRVDPDLSSYGYFLSLVGEHGPIVESRSIPRDEQLLSAVLSEQKAARDKMRKAPVKASLSAKIAAAEAKKDAASVEGITPAEISR